MRCYLIEVITYNDGTKESLEDKMALVVNTINNFNCKKQ